MRLLIATTCFCLVAIPPLPNQAELTLPEKSPARFDPATEAPSQPQGTTATLVVAKTTEGQGSQFDTAERRGNTPEADGIVASSDLQLAAIPSEQVPLPPRRRPSDKEVCEALTAAAHSNGLPVPFFIRLIWQESQFDSRAVSPVGAQGMAQFMPETAKEHGLGDPFNPLEALRASARMLRGLFQQFGNLGLAAAAYNAGAGRIQEWLTKRGKLPNETRHYVLNVTGRAPEHWKSVSANHHDDLRVPKDSPCRPANAVMVANLFVPDPGPPKPKPTAGKTPGKHFIAQAEDTKTKTKAKTATISPIKSIVAPEPKGMKVANERAKSVSAIATHKVASAKRGTARAIPATPVKTTQQQKTATKAAARTINKAAAKTMAKTAPAQTKSAKKTVRKRVEMAMAGRAARK